MTLISIKKGTLMESQIINPIEKLLFTEAPKPSTWIEIDTKALSHNLWLYKKTAPHAKFMPILKSNAYGHGLELVAKVCDAHEAVDLLGVVCTQEAIQLKNLGIKKDILILSIADQLKTIVELNLATVLYDLQTASELNRSARHSSR